MALYFKRRTNTQGVSHSQPLFLNKIDFKVNKTIQDILVEPTYNSFNDSSRFRNGVLTCMLN